MQPNFWIENYILVLKKSLEQKAIIKYPKEDRLKKLIKFNVISIWLVQAMLRYFILF